MHVVIRSKVKGANSQKLTALLRNSCGIQIGCYDADARSMIQVVGENNLRVLRVTETGIWEGCSTVIIGIAAGYCQ